MFGTDAAVANREVLIDIDSLALWTAFDDSVALVVVLVRLLVAVVDDTLRSTFLVPDIVTARAVEVMRPARLVAISVIAKSTVVDVRRRMWSRPLIGVRKVVRRLVLRHDRAGGLNDVVGLRLGDDVVDGVVGHIQAVAIGLARCELVRATAADQAIEVVVLERLAHRTT